MNVYSVLRIVGLGLSQFITNFGTLPSRKPSTVIFMNFQTIALADLSDTRSEWKDVIAGVARPEGSPVMITIDGKPAVAMISAEEFDQYRKEKVRERLTDVFKELDEVNKALVNK